MVVGSKIDPYSFIELEGVTGLIEDINPKTNIFDFRGLEHFNELVRNRRKAEKWRDLSLPLKILSEKEIDILVAQADTVPLNLGSGYVIAAVLKRSNPFDVLISKYNMILDEHPQGVTIVISGCSRRGQLLYYRGDLDLIERDFYRESLKHLMNRKEVEGVVTSAREAEAFSMQERVVEVFTPSITVPQAGQGAICLIVRADDRKAKGLAGKLNHHPSMVEFNLERKFLESLTEYQEDTVSVIGSVKDEEFKLEASVVSPDGSNKVSSEIWGWRGNEGEAINNLRDELFEAGGREMIHR